MYISVLFCAILGMAMAGPMKTKGRVDKMAVAQVSTFDPTKFWIAAVKIYPEEKVYMDNPCVGGTPFYSSGCAMDMDCPAGFSCLPTSDKAKHVCCLTEKKIMPYMQCPGTSAPSANKFCHSHSECDKGSQCHKEWSIPEELMAELEEKYEKTKDPEDKRPLDPTGICCSPSYDNAPAVMHKCPKDYVSTRHMPCGVSLPGCDLGAKCMYTDHSFGRCCLSKDAAAEIGLKFSFPFGFLQPFTGSGSSSSANAQSISGGFGGLGGSFTGSSANARSLSGSHGGLTGSSSSAGANSFSGGNLGGFSGSSANANSGSFSGGPGGRSGSSSSANAGSFSGGPGGVSGSSANANSRSFSTGK